MLAPDPQQRPTAAQLLDYPWLAAAAPPTAISTSIMHQLQLFAGLSRARRVMLGVAARNINGSEASRLLKAFLAVDQDFNGTVEFHELAVAAKQVGGARFFGEGIRLRPSICSLVEVQLLQNNDTCVG